MTDSAPPLARVLVRNTVWTSLGNYANVALGFVANLILTRLLPVETFGFLSMGNFWTSQLNLKPKSGLHYAGIQHPRLNGELLGTFWAMDLILAVASFALSGAVATALAPLGYPAPVLLSLLVLMVTECLPALVGAIGMALERELQVSRLMLNAVLASVAGYAIAIGLALAGVGVWSLLAVNLSLAVLGSAGVYVVCRQRLPWVLRERWRFSGAVAKELLRQGLPTGLSLTAVLSFVATYDNFLVGTFVGYDALGFYDRAYRTAQWPNLLLSTVVGRIGFLMFARVQHDPDRLLHAVRISLWVLLTFGIPAGLLLAFGAPDLIGLLYGERWLESALYLPFIAVFALAGLVSTLAFWLAVALKDTRVSVWLALSQAMALVAVATPLTWLLGINGTLIGVGATAALAASLGIRYILQRVSLPAGEVWLPVGIATPVAVVCLWTLTRWPVWPSLHALAHICALAAVTGLAFLGTLAAVRPGQFRERLAYLWQAWRRTT